MMKEQQRSLQEIVGEVSDIKAQMNKGPVTDKVYIAGEQTQPSTTAGKRWFDKGRDVDQHLQTSKLAYYNQLRSGGIASIIFINHFSNSNLPLSQTNLEREKFQGKLKLNKIE